MKIEIKARTKDNSEMIIKGNRHRLKLNSGEIINVITDKRTDDVLGPMWFVSHIESGLNIIPPQYYCYPRLVFFGDCDLDPTTERNALIICKFVFDGYYKNYGKTFKQIFEERERKLKDQI